MMKSSNRARDVLADQARRAGDFVFTGSQTPHDPDTGVLIGSMRDISEDARKMLSTGILFIDVQSDRIRAQSWRALQNLQATLAAAGSDLSKIVYLRVYLRDITDEPTVREVMKIVLGNMVSAGELVGATNAGASDNIDVQFDAIALASKANHRLESIHLPNLASITAPFASATRAGGFLFTSMIPGISPATGEPVNSISQLAPQNQTLAEKAGPYTRYVEYFVAQHFAMWQHFNAILNSAGIRESEIIYYKTWIRRSMREASHAYLTDIFSKIAGGLFCFTRFPVSALRHPGSLVEGRIIAVLPQQGASKIIKVPPHGVSSFYIGTIEAGPLVITAGEVPIDTANRRVIEKASDLGDDMRRLAYGRIHRESPIMAQADYIYGLLEEALFAHGISFEDVVHQSVYLTDASDYPALERMACLRFGQKLPPTSIVPIVGASPFAATRVEIEVTASAKSTTAVYSSSHSVTPTR